MAGWSMITAGDNSTESYDDNDDIRCRFDNALKIFRQEIFALDVDFPPMLGNGQPVDLFKLYLVVKEKGGYDTVSKNGLWGVVADESGFGVNLASSVKLVYVKYLDALEKRLERAVEDKNSSTKSSGSASNLVELEVSGSELKGFSNWKSVLNVCAELGSGEKCIAADEESSVHVGSKRRSIVDCVEVGNSGSDMAKSSVVDSFFNDDNKSKDVRENLESNSANMKASEEDEVKSDIVDLDGSEKRDNGNEHDVVMVDSVTIDASNSSRKRKRESLSKMVKWITGIARNPCDDVVASLPELSKWESYGKEELWKQVLLVRESLFRKGNADIGAEQSSGQKNRKMHPCMYDDHVGSIYNFRERLKCSRKLLSEEKISPAQARPQLSSSANESNIDSNVDCSTKGSVLDRPADNPVPLGPDFQAEVPEWTGVTCESDSKWVGERIWPLQVVNNRFVVEREPIGKGRQDSCGCEAPKSIKCVRFHISERRMRVRRELGLAFYHWNFDRMGEDVNLSWKTEEEKKFEAIVQSNPPSLEKDFWKEIVKYFSKKRSVDLVSYYFNVFVLKRRAHQNRHSPNNIHSDDDDDDDGGESESGVARNSSGREAPKSPGSLLNSAKKSRKVGR